MYTWFSLFQNIHTHEHLHTSSPHLLHCLECSLHKVPLWVIKGHSIEDGQDEERQSRDALHGEQQEADEAQALTAAGLLLLCAKLLESRVLQPGGGRGVGWRS